MTEIYCPLDSCLRFGCHHLCTLKNKLYSYWSQSKWLLSLGKWWICPSNITEEILRCVSLTGVFPCFFLSCKANARVKLAIKWHGPHSSKLVICVVMLLFVLFYVLFVRKCVLYHCHRMLTQLQLTNITYHITYNTCQCRGC